MNAKSSPPVLVQVLSGILWITAGLALAVCLSARYRSLDSGSGSLRNPDFARSEVPDDPVSDEPATVAYEMIRPAPPATMGFHAASSVHRMYFLPPGKVAIVLPLEPVSVPVNRSLFLPR
jgi:hypothetical protein